MSDPSLGCRLWKACKSYCCSCGPKMAAPLGVSWLTVWADRVTCEEVGACDCTSGPPGSVSGCGFNGVLNQSLDFGDLFLRECAGICALLNSKTSGRYLSVNRLNIWCGGRCYTSVFKSVLQGRTTTKGRKAVASAKFL